MQHTDHPLVSIVIPTYNNAHYIDATIESCLGQTYPHCEIIVVDDGSTDGTSEMLAARYGDRLRTIYQENAGPAAARNTGIRQAQGEFIQFCDADDQLLPDKITRCMDVFRQQPEVGVVYTRYQHVDVDGHTPLPIPDPPLLSGDIFCDLLLSNGNAILTSATLVRRDALLAVGGFDENRALQGTEDWDLYLRLAETVHYASIEDLLVLYRRHVQGLTANALSMAMGRLITVQKARDYPRRRECLDDAAFDALEADRHHILGHVYWRLGQRAAARDAFRAAQRLKPSLARRLYGLLTYVAPAQFSERLVQTGLRLRSTGHARSGTIEESA